MSTHRYQLKFAYATHAKCLRQLGWLLQKQCFLSLWKSSNVHLYKPDCYIVICAMSYKPCLDLLKPFFVHFLVEYIMSEVRVRSYIKDMETHWLVYISDVRNPNSCCFFILYIYTFESYSLLLCATQLGNAKTLRDPKAIIIRTAAPFMST